MSAGRPKEISDSEIINQIKESSDPFVTAGELADQLSLTPAAIRNRLNELEQSDLVKSKSTGSGKGWWLELG